jgi:hypothetical protein
LADWKKMRRVILLLLFVATVGCSSGTLHKRSAIPQETVAALTRVRIGMSVEQVLEIMKPVSLDWCRLYCGGSGAGEWIFQISATKQVRLSVEPKIRPDVSGQTRSNFLPNDDELEFIVRSIGKPEPKRAWVVERVANRPNPAVGNGSSEVLSEAEVSREIAVQLMDWGAFGPVPVTAPEYVEMEASVISRIHGLRGFSESDDFQGDGTDWYEIEFSPDTAAELRSALNRLPALKKTKRKLPQGDEKPPSWWPKTWPADAQCYEKDLIFFVLPDTGTHAWLERYRT